MTYLSARFSFWQLLLRKEYMIEPPTLSYIVKNLKGQDKRKWVSR